MAQQVEERLSKINELAQHAAKELGLILLSVRIGQQGKNKNLEVSIYRKEPAISFSDCEQMSLTLEKLLSVEESDKYAIINGPYSLEVMSAGIDRQLSNAFEFKLFAGSKVRVTTKEKIGCLSTEFTGILLDGDQDSITLSKVIPLSDKLPKKGAIKKKEIVGNDQLSQEEKITISLQKVYRVHLFPDIKENSKLHKDNLEK